jgi:hypothetical protein
MRQLCSGRFVVSSSLMIVIERVWIGVGVFVGV